MTIYSVKLLSGKIIHVLPTWIGGVPNKKGIIREVKRLAKRETSEEVIEIRRLMTNELIWEKEHVDKS